MNRPKAKRTPVTATTRMVVQTEIALAKGTPAADPAWLVEVRGRLPQTWAKVSDVALALDVSSSTVRNWVETGLIMAVDYAVRTERAAWNIYVPSVIEFLRHRAGGKQ